MLSREQAQKKVEVKINEPDPYWPEKPKIVVLEELTIEREWGWVFFYQSSEYIETQNFNSQLVGNAPYIVNKLSRELIETGTAFSIEYYINEYEKQIPPSWPVEEESTSIDESEASKSEKQFRFLDLSAMPVSVGPPDENTIIPMGWILLWILVIALAGLLIWIIF